MNSSDMRIAFVAGIARMLSLTLSAADALADAEFRAQASEAAPSIGFHVWHAARWADLLQGTELASIPGIGGEQIWTSERLAERWSFGELALGAAATGMGVDEDVSLALPLPVKAELLDYARRSFAAATERLEALSDDQFYGDATTYKGDRRVLAEHLVMHLTHFARHLGMIEGLTGALGRSGTATQ